MPRTVQIRDVASHAGVSTATVSHVLNGTRVVSDATRARVLASARHLAYHPSAIARSLKTKATGTLGVLVSDISNPFSTGVVRGIENVASANGYNVILCNTDELEEKANTYLNLLLAKRVEGLIVAPIGGTAGFAERFLAVGTTIVLIDRRIEGSDLPFVGTANVDAARDAVTHLVQDGHRRIGMIAGLTRVSTSVERMEGYRRALLEYGIAVEKRLVRTGHSTVDGGAAAARELLEQDDPPSALFTTNNLMTLGALKMFAELGLRCPDEISLVGFDDHEWAGIFSPPLTVVRQPTHEIGTAAADLLIELIRTPAKAPRSIVLPSTLIVRGSCRPGGHRGPGAPAERVPRRERRGCRV